MKKNGLPDESNSPNYESDVSTPTDNQSFSPEPDRNTSPSVQRPSTEELTVITDIYGYNREKVISTKGRGVPSYEVSTRGEKIIFPFLYGYRR